MTGRMICFTLPLLFLLIISFAGAAFAVPELQIYIEGSVYDIGTETWITTSPNFRVWVLGNVSYKPIYGVNLVVVHDKAESGSITISPATASFGSLPLPGDPSTPGTISVTGNGYDTAPLTGDGSALPSHGIYGPGTAWTTYLLGDFTLTDSPIGDYIGSIPNSFPATGQINAYDVTVSGYSGVHFDAFDHVINGGGKNKYVFAPFSHDGEGKTPEPATLSLLGIGLAGLLRLRKRI